ncbi:MAG: hypothetical protein IJE77_11450 [Thermoguttaceae bacterium]|nr:hypothetical protein [Thermoguttaceae bacterium]MBQ9801245.1 hypothetical protein [Thermoguttaceae bacterium]
MKRFAALALAVLTTFGFVAAANAQTAVAPLVTKDATTIVRVDLSQIDGPQLSQTAQKLAGAAIDYFVADADQAKEMKNAAPLIGMFAAQYAELYVAPLKDAGVSEFYVIVDKAVDAENPAYPYVAISISDLSKEQIDEIRAALSALNGQLNGALKYRFARHGFMIVPMIPETVDADEAKAYVKARFTKIAKVDDAVFAEGFQRLGDGAVVSAVGIATETDPAAKAQIDEAIEQIGAVAPEGLADFAQKSLAWNKDFVELTRYGAWKLDLNALEVLGFVETKSPEDAQKYLALVDEVKKETTAFVEKTIDAQLATVEDENKPTQEDVDLLKSDLGAVVDAFLGAIKADGATLTWKLDEQFFVDTKPVFDKLVADGIAIQAEIAPAEEALEEDAEPGIKFDIDVEVQKEEL